MPADGNDGDDNAINGARTQELVVARKDSVCERERVKVGGGCVLRGCWREVLKAGGRGEPCLRVSLLCSCEGGWGV